MYNLEIERVNRKIKELGAKKVLIQLPEGLKPVANKIADRLNAIVYIWAGSCFGACDIPNVDVDLIVQWGHSEWLLE
ncbi:hypothetical protein DRN75_00270 [Nanoarchaeota archaeon]|nr:MAG: hypothetical protein DRN75_00270 [Nanoarchaeota archaeon]